jgi:protein CpxP
MPRSLTETFACSAMLAVGLLAMPLAAVAQDETSGPPPMTNSPSMNASMMHKHHHRGDSMRDLDLTETQKAQIKEIREKFKNEHPDPEAVTMGEHKALMERIKAVLTPEQREKWSEGKKMRHKRPHPDQMPTVAP